VYVQFIPSSGNDWRQCTLEVLSTQISMLISTALHTSDRALMFKFCLAINFTNTYFLSYNVGAEQIYSYIRIWMLYTGT
jgi:hypothetical protein